MTENIDLAKAHFDLGLQAMKDGDFSLAEGELRKAHHFCQNRASILLNLSSALMLQEKWPEALIFCLQLLAIEPNDYEGHINFGICHLKTNNPDLALSEFNRAIEIDPYLPAAMINKGNLLLEQNLFSEARHYLQQALQINPNSEEALIGLGNLHNELKDYKQGLNYLSKAITINENNSFAKWNKSLSLLRLGDFKEGWSLYESRWQVPGMGEHARFHHLPLWLGAEPLLNKTILVYAEQGFGDAIQMSRYLLTLEQEMRAKVIFAVPNPLTELMKSLSPTIEILELEDAATLPIEKLIDYQCPVMSLPLAFKTTLATIPTPSPYLFADARKRLIWQQKMIDGSTKYIHHQETPFRVGITWSGSGHYAGKINPKRDIPFSLVSSLVSSLDRYPIEFHAIQKDIDSEWVTTESDRLILYKNCFKNFSDTAALIAELDLVISVDTAVGHLAGSLGKETFLLIPDPPDFMSLLETSQHPWYPKTTLIRQKKRGVWPLDEIKTYILNYFHFFNR